jgi:hypothetical protein
LRRCPPELGSRSSDEMRCRNEPQLSVRYQEWSGDRNGNHPRPVTWGVADLAWCPRGGLNSENRCPGWVSRIHLRSIAAGQSRFRIQGEMSRSRQVWSFCDQFCDQRMPHEAVSAANRGLYAGMGIAGEAAASMGPEGRTGARAGGANTRPGPARRHMSPCQSWQQCLSSSAIRRASMPRSLK